MIPTNPHSSRRRRQAESSQPSGIPPTGFDSPRLNARDAHVHQGVSRSTTVSARASRSSSESRSFPSAIQASPASTRVCVARHSSSDGRTQPGFHWYRSRWITGKPVFADNAREKVLFPDPAIPITSTRRPTAPAGPSIKSVSQGGRSRRPFGARCRQGRLTSPVAVLPQGKLQSCSSASEAITTCPFVSSCSEGSEKLRRMSLVSNPRAVAPSQKAG